MSNRAFTLIFAQRIHRLRDISRCDIRLLRSDRRSGQGFTLIELLIVITLIVLITAVAVPSYNRFVAKGRDSRRQSDIKTLQSALSQYRSDQGFYPASISFGDPLRSPSGAKTYLGKTPQDPLTSAGKNLQYRFVAKPAGCNNSNLDSLCTDYCLYSNLEDSALGMAVSECTDDSSYNYSVSSL